MLNSIAFVTPEDFRASEQLPDVTSFILVRVRPGVPPATVASRIQDEIPEVSALTVPAFAAEERRLVMDMGADILAIMSMIGFVIGLAVVALSVYIATVSRRAEYGVLAALGARRRFLYAVVLGQALISSAAGFILAVAATIAIAVLVPRFGLSLELDVTPAAVARVGLIAVMIAALAAVLPIRQMANLDPATVFRRGVL